MIWQIELHQVVILPTNGPSQRDAPRQAVSSSERPRGLHRLLSSRQSSSPSQRRPLCRPLARILRLLYLPSDELNARVAVRCRGLMHSSLRMLLKGLPSDRISPDSPPFESSCGQQVVRPDRLYKRVNNVLLLHWSNRVFSRQFGRVLLSSL